MHEEERTLSNDIGSQHFASDCLLHAFGMLSSRKRCERVGREESTDLDVLQLEEVGETSTKLYHGWTLSQRKRRCRQGWLSQSNGNASSKKKIVGSNLKD